MAQTLEANSQSFYGIIGWQLISCFRTAFEHTSDDLVSAAMRNLFDQYVHPENRLTHALTCCLAEDPALLASFLRWVGVAPPRGERLTLVEQRLPGEPNEADEQTELTERRLPDAWIYTESGWALLIESKISAPIDAAQLRGHLAIAERRGFSSIELLVLSPLPPLRALPDRCRHQCWKHLYQWACGEGSSLWARQLTAYLSIAEQHMVDDGYLLEGTLTTFTGIPFGSDHPYTYLEAKRLLRLLTTALRSERSLVVELGADLTAPGRVAITGSIQESVWDFIGLEAAGTESSFTHYPHLTLAIQRDRVLVPLTMGNEMARELKRRLLEGGYDAFKSAIEAFVIAASSLLASDPGAVPFVIVQQRRYPSRRSMPIRDALLEFDPRTALGGHGGIKVQEQWLRATFDAFANRRSNIQLSLGIAFPYATSTRVHDTGFVSTVCEAWCATRPLLDRAGLSPPRPATASLKKPATRSRSLPPSRAVGGRRS